MRLFGRRSQAMQVGMGVGFLGLIVLLFRYGFRKVQRGILPETLSPEKFATRVAQTLHGEIVYHCAGSGRQLLFLHGMYAGASSYEWSGIYPLFADQCSVYAMDWIGFGESERPEKGLSLEEQGESLADFLRGIGDGVGPATVIASGAAFLPLALVCSRHPELVDRIILWCPMDKPHAMGAAGLTSLHRMHLLKRFVYRNHFATPRFIKAWLERSLPAGRPLNPEIAQTISLCAQQYGAEHAILALGAWHEDLPEAPVHTPCHLLWPAAVDDRLAESIRTRLTSCREFRTVEHAGYLSPLDDPAAIAPVIREILNGPIRPV